MRWCGKCWCASGGDGEQRIGGDGDDAEQIVSPVRNVIYNRIGRVEKSRHGGIKTACIVTTVILKYP